ncbi:hypothetical protein G9P44_001147 [Scheffersomyces stipitis]|nr:hypothetical protein G9P44_001147 [Scheffersomyces stipitis]
MTTVLVNVKEIKLFFGILLMPSSSLREIRKSVLHDSVQAGVRCCVPRVNTAVPNSLIFTGEERITFVKNSF